MRRTKGRKSKKREIVKKNFDAACCICLKKYESDELQDIPESCCGQKLIINANRLLLSDFKEELCEKMKTKKEVKDEVNRHLRCLFK